MVEKKINMVEELEVRDKDHHYSQKEEPHIPSKEETEEFWKDKEKENEK